VQQRYLGRLTEGMEVCDSAGQKFGSIARVYRHDAALTGVSSRAGSAPRDELIEVRTGFLGFGRHIFVPVGCIEEVTPNCIFLKTSADEAKHKEEWRFKPSYLDDLH
jgi:hypothetical protein